MAIQLYNLEGQPMETIPDGTPVPGGRWTTPTGGREWQNGGQQQTPPQQTSTPPPQPQGGGAQTYAQQRPDLVTNWNNAQTSAYQNDPVAQKIRSYPSLEAYLQADQAGYPGGFGVTQQQPTPTQTQPTPPSTGNTQPQLPSTTNTGFGALTPGGSSNSTTPWNTQTFLQNHPDVLANWNNDPSYKSFYGTLDNYALAAVKANGTPQEQAAAATFNPSQGSAQGYTPVTSSGATGGNYAQNQNAAQGGQYSTSGTTNTAQAQTSGSNTAQTQTGASNTAQQTNQTTNQTQAVTGGSTQQQQSVGTQAQTGATTEQQQGNVATTGASVTKPIDTLGFGALLQGATGQAQANDQSRNTFLNDMVNTGGSAVNSQVDQAVRNSLTGPQMTGAGDNARARAAGYAGAQIARQNTDQRLNAAQQLAGPSGLQTLVSAGNPYLGSATANASNQASAGSTTGTSATTGSNTNTTNTTGTNFQNLVGSTNTAGTNNTQQATSGATNTAQTGFQNLLGTQSETGAGTATGQSSQAASGQIPQAQQVSTGGGGCIICTAAVHHGLWRNKRLLRRVVSYKLQHDWPRFRRAVRGYFFLFTPLAKWSLKHRTIADWTLPIAKAVVYEELRISGWRVPFKLWSWMAHWTWHGVCSAVGRLPVSDTLQDNSLITTAKKHNIFFPIGGAK